MLKRNLTTAAAAFALAAAAALAFAGGSARAQPGVGPAAGPGGPGMYTQRMNDRLARLKAQLAITAAQENAWSAFASAAEGMHSGKRPPMHAPGATTAGLVPAPRVFAALAERAQTMADNAKKLSNAAAGLYRVLTPTQRAVFDTHLADRRAAMHHWHGRWQKGHGPWPPRSMQNESGGGN